MRSLLVAAALGLGSLGLIGATPSQANASWLSEALHARFDPNYYGTPAYGYYGPDYVAPPSYYSAPYYQPGVSFYWGGGTRYYGHWHGYRGAWHAAPHTVWHGGGHAGHVVHHAAVRGSGHGHRR
jgi:hypothetical protein